MERPTSATIGSIGNGANDVAVDVLTGRVYVMKAYQSASEVAVFSGVGSRFPLPLLDELNGPGQWNQVERTLADA